MTLSEAEADPPGPASVEVTVLVVSVKVPIMLPLILTDILHDCPAASTFEELVNVPVPGEMLMLPPPVASVLQLPPVCVISVRPAGNTLLNETLCSATGLGLVTVTVRIDVPSTPMVEGLKAAVIVGRTGFASTLRLTLTVWLSSVAAAVPIPELVGVTDCVALPDASMAAEGEALKAPAVTANAMFNP